MKGRYSVKDAAKSLSPEGRIYIAEATIRRLNRARARGERVGKPRAMYRMARRAKQAIKRREKDNAS